MNFEDCVVASLPPLLISDWGGRYIAVLRATNNSVMVVSVGRTIEEARAKAYEGISQRANQRDKMRIFGEILDMNFGDELVLEGHIRVFMAYCDFRTYYVADRCPPKSVYVGISGVEPLTVKFVRIKEGL